MQDKIQKILLNPIFKDALQKINMLEKDRIYCKHDLSHFLDVARIGYVYILENNLSISQPEIYGAALLHDIGRFQQYVNKTPHHEVSARMAPDILRSSGYLEPEIEEIVNAIWKHGSKKNHKINSLSYVLYMADKESRLCFSCEATEFCNWSEEKKNRTINF